MEMRWTGDQRSAARPMPAWFRDVLARYKRVAIAGGPGSGKTTLASAVTDRTILHTDDLIHEKWEDVPGIVRLRLAGLAAFVVEGVQVPRALRRGLEVDAVVWLRSAKVPLTPGQRTMAKAVGTVFEQWRAISAGRVPVIQEGR
jgi:hypothetical protein